MRAESLERATNVAVLVTAIIVGSVTVHRFLGSRTRGPRDLRGTVLGIPGLPTGHRVVVLALSSRCKFCTLSAPFYRRLIAAHERGGPPVSVLLDPQDAGARQYVKELGLADASMALVVLGAVGIEATPSVLVLDEQRRVTHNWFGLLDSAAEDEVLRTIGASRVARMGSADDDRR